MKMSDAPIFEVKWGEIDRGSKPSKASVTIEIGTETTEHFAKREHPSKWALGLSVVTQELVSRTLLPEHEGRDRDFIPPSDRRALLDMFDWSEGAVSIEESMVCSTTTSLVDNYTEELDIWKVNAKKDSLKYLNEARAQVANFASVMGFKQK